MAKERALYSSRVTPGRQSSSSQDTMSDYGRVIHSNFHFAEGPSALYTGRRSALEDLAPINKPLVSLDINIDVSLVGKNSLTRFTSNVDFSYRAAEEERKSRMAFRARRWPSFEAHDRCSSIKSCIINEIFFYIFPSRAAR